MRPPRMTTRRWMLAVAIMAVGLGAWMLSVRSRAYAVQAGNHGVREAMCWMGPSPESFGLMQERLAAAFVEFLARNRGAGGRRDYYGVWVDEVADDASRFDLTLVFKSGVRYCCAEPGCHTGFGPADLRSWRRLRAILERDGLVGIPPMTLYRLRGIVERGALLECHLAFGLPLESEGYTYEVGPYHERKA
jgi:hypothetical protein